MEPKITSKLNNNANVILNGYLFDREFFDDYMDTPEARSKYIEWWTKPIWA